MILNTSAANIHCGCPDGGPPVDFFTSALQYGFYKFIVTIITSHKMCISLLLSVVHGNFQRVAGEAKLGNRSVSLISLKNV